MRCQHLQNLVKYLHHDREHAEHRAAEQLATAETWQSGHGL